MQREMRYKELDWSCSPNSFMVLHNLWIRQSVMGTLSPGEVGEQLCDVDALDGAALW